ncbi:histidine phosphatase family protein [Shewanella acanthi]|uniref:histidine phosphatase family protein n=1 Tax=Shewanella acanthi TaxID=2864212 RepID=UPI001C65F97C|nr:histidine phosphatase family protein [Shewanella acanthi]QYJ78377.1 histidine phosphatase family protein [Shewanella acanthi]
MATMPYHSFRRPNIFVALVLAIACVFSSAVLGMSSAYADNRLIILVRHAEKSDYPIGDPALSSAGELRAISLISALKRTPLSQLIATQYQRTQQTLAPIAMARHLTVTVLPAKKPIEAHIQQIVEQVHAVKGNTLIVGHSNTIPLIIKALNGPELNAMAEDDYSQLFLLSIQDGQKASLITTHYGQE